MFAAALANNRCTALRRVTQVRRDASDASKVGCSTHPAIYSRLFNRETSKLPLSTWRFTGQRCYERSEQFCCPGELDEEESFGRRSLLRSPFGDGLACVREEAPQEAPSPEAPRRRNSVVSASTAKPSGRRRAFRIGGPHLRLHLALMWGRDNSSLRHLVRLAITSRKLNQLDSVSIWVLQKCPATERLWTRLNLDVSAATLYLGDRPRHVLNINS